jgi:hypothetical protein
MQRVLVPAWGHSGRRVYLTAFKRYRMICQWNASMFGKLYHSAGSAARLLSHCREWHSSTQASRAPDHYRFRHMSGFGVGEVHENRVGVPVAALRCSGRV